jgi:hypothetical protein
MELIGWDYAGMCEILEPAIQKIRDTHTPAVFHVEEITQPQGHSTSGSHERYKTSERLEWEKEWDGLKQMREWIIANALTDDAELTGIEEKARLFVKESKQNAWTKYIEPIKTLVAQTVEILKALEANPAVKKLSDELIAIREPMRRDVMKTLATVLDLASNDTAATAIRAYYEKLKSEFADLYNSYLYNDGPRSALKVPVINAAYADDSTMVNGYEVLNKYFDELFATNNRVVAFGEDLGHIGDVNQGFSGLQEKHGKDRIFDTGIRELTIMGQGIGLALRGLRPIAEIQYLDYLLYGLQPLSDDVCTTHFRTAGQQSCPLIVRTRGHRLEGIWHSGSPMGMIINALRGMYVCVPRTIPCCKATIPDW